MIISPQTFLFLLISTWFLTVAYVFFKVFIDAAIASLVPASYFLTFEMADNSLKLPVFMITCFAAGSIIIWRQGRRNVSD